MSKSRQSCWGTMSKSRQSFWGTKLLLRSRKQHSINYKSASSWLHHFLQLTDVWRQMEPGRWTRKKGYSEKRLLHWSLLNNIAICTIHAQEMSLCHYCLSSCRFLPHTHRILRYILIKTYRWKGKGKAEARSSNSIMRNQHSHFARKCYRKNDSKHLENVWIRVIQWETQMLKFNRNIYPRLPCVGSRLVEGVIDGIITPLWT